MITLAVWVLLFVALGIAAHLFGVDSRDADFSMRMAQRAASTTPPPRARADQGAQQIR